MAVLLFLVLVTLTLVPKANVLWAAVMAAGLKILPDAVLRPAKRLPYQAALPSMASPVLAGFAAAGATTGATTGAAAGVVTAGAAAGVAGACAKASVDAAMVKPTTAVLSNLVVFMFFP